MSLKFKKRRCRIFHTYFFLLIVALIALFPVVYVISSSFKSNSEIMVHPEYIFPRRADV
ncbi:MAG: hypothetical protein L6V93_17900 [Clostridiales bacterium]|nr:MAG: hypothetical protein L6V93_17900 [Clostridiales bacterium]